MGLEEPPHCPFDVMEACRTGARRDPHQPGWKCSRPTAWPSPSATARTAAQPAGVWARLVVPVAVGREDSKRSVVAAAGVVVLLRKRWIRMELMMGVESDRHGPATG